MRLSRRKFVHQAAVANAAALISEKISWADAPLTASQIVEQIKSHLGFEWNNTTYRDTFKAGEPNTPVTGVASTFMATLDVLKRAHAAGLNFVITHEPTFWSDPDRIAPFENDPLYKAKVSYVKENNMVVWRFHDHWHRMPPEPMRAAEIDLLGWKQYTDPNNPNVYRIPPMPLRAVAGHIAQALKFKSVRVIGDPDLSVTSVAHCGHDLPGCMRALSIADAVTAIEIREWETAEYVRDLIRSGQKKAMIDLPHEGEEGGMELFSRWLPKQIPGLRVEFVSTTDRLWTV